MRNKVRLCRRRFSSVRAPSGADAGFGSGDKGASGAPFLKTRAGSAARGYGRAYSAVGDDIHAIYYNPAGLGFLKKVEITGMHSRASRASITISRACRCAAFLGGDDPELPTPTASWSVAV